MGVEYIECLESLLYWPHKETVKQPVKIKLVIIVKVSILITLHNIKTKIKLQSSFAHLHVVANLYDLLSSVKPQSNFLKMSPVFHLSIQWKSVKLFWAPLTKTMATSFKVSFCLFHRRKQVIQVSKWWHTLLFKCLGSVRFLMKSLLLIKAVFIW